MDKRHRFDMFGVVDRMSSEPGDPSAPAWTSRLADQLCGMFPSSPSLFHITEHRKQPGAGRERCHLT